MKYSPERIQELESEHAKFCLKLAEQLVENHDLREVVKDALNILSRPHTHDKILSSYNAVQINKLLKKLHIVSQTSKAV